MQIVINISEEYYNTLKKDIKSGHYLPLGDIYIANGTPLPKGHGDLIDRKELLENKYKINSVYCEYDEVVYVDDIKDAPTIIEADRKRG